MNGAREESTLFLGVREMRDALVIDGYASGVARIAAASVKQQQGHSFMLRASQLAPTLISTVHAHCIEPSDARTVLAEIGALIAAEIDRLQQLERVTAYTKQPEEAHHAFAD